MSAAKEQSVREDALELKDVVEGDVSLAEKAKAAAEALKDPGAAGRAGLAGGGN